MATPAQLRNRYTREAVTTASPAQLVTMLYDRLLRDLADAERGIDASDIQATHNALMHAQDILQEFQPRSTPPSGRKASRSNAFTSGVCRCS